MNSIEEDHATLVSHSSAEGPLARVHVLLVCEGQSWMQICTLQLRTHCHIRAPSESSLPPRQPNTTLTILQPRLHTWSNVTSFIHLLAALKRTQAKCQNAIISIAFK